MSFWTHCFGTAVRKELDPPFMNHHIFFSTYEYEEKLPLLKKDKHSYTFDGLIMYCLIDFEYIFNHLRLTRTSEFILI